MVGSDLAVALLLDGEEGARFCRISPAFVAAFGLDAAAAVVGRRVGEVLSGETRLPLDRAIGRAQQSGERIETGVPVRIDGRPLQQLSLTVHPLDVPARGVVVEVRATAPTPSLAAVGPAALIDQLNHINAGVARVYDRSPWAALNLAGLLGYAEGEPGASVPVIHPQDVHDFAGHRRRLTSALDGEIVRVTARMAHRDGGWRRIEVREQVLQRTLRGGVRQVLGFARDVTDHHRLAESLGRVSASLTEAEAVERRRIARELHDAMAQHLVAIDLGLSRLQREAGAGLPADAVRDIREALSAAHGEARTFSYLLHPPDLERLGLSRTLAKFVDGFGRRTGLRMHLDIDRAPEGLQPPAELTLFRVAQEALMNVHQHAQAQAVRVSLTGEVGCAMLEVVDDGIGLDASEIQGLMSGGEGGVGIAGMRARVEHLGGRLELFVPGRGLGVRAILPSLTDALEVGV